ncbi:MAG: hypothetical protein KA250_05095 [Verrucomicrobiales bacterium]|jgi:alginate O-acetyltransferase complex protein AlgJ|nr:hypothetical protein [Verrucomicrobiales bacterium]MBP9224141.1 hypothetical protein [Verrucomicrobiales bacterium]HQZ27043.1 hypothetical protein [Verrucomicrobiales bacterium]
MKQNWLHYLIFGAAITAPVHSAEGTRGLEFAEAVRALIEPKPSIQGADPDWFFLVKELRHLSLGSFWERPWEEVAANKSNPVETMQEFHRQLEEKGIRLLVVPVPAKTSLYPEKLLTGFQSGDVVSIAPFLEQIRKAGIDVLDLEPVLLEAQKADSEVPLYCRQDAHFSPRTIELIAEFIAKSLAVTEPAPGGQFVVSEPETLSISGDQIEGSEWEGKVDPEPLSVRFVSQQGTRGVKPDPASPVLLLGDSHTLVFHSGKEDGMHCHGAGLVDHLAARLGFAPDLVGVRGSGMIQARKQLFYKSSATPGYWVGKQVVIWLFSVREFTQSTDRPVAIPLER